MRGRDEAAPHLLPGSAARRRSASAASKLNTAKSFAARVSAPLAPCTSGVGYLEHENRGMDENGDEKYGRQRKLTIGRYR